MYFGGTITASPTINNPINSVLINVTESIFCETDTEILETSTMLRGPPASYLTSGDFVSFLPFVRTKSRIFPRGIFVHFCICDLYLDISKKNLFYLNRKKLMGTLHENLCKFVILSRHVSAESRKFQINVEEI
jgi:hypothetical protein